MRFYLPAFAPLTAAIGIAPINTVHTLHEERHSIPEEWIKLGELPPDHVIPVRIGMNQPRLEEGHDLLMEVSDRHSPKYGRWYTAEEVSDIFAPPQKAVEDIRDWLHAAGIEPNRIGQSWNKQWILLDSTAAELGNLLKTKYHSYIHTPTGKKHMACDKYHVPEHVKEHIDYITPGIKLFYPGRKDLKSANVEPSLRKRKIKSGPVLSKLPIPIEQILSLGELKLCGAVITPACIQKLYNISDSTKAPVKGNELGIFEDLGDHFSKTDLDLFFTTLKQNIPRGTYPINHPIDGAFGPAATLNSAGIESDLDFQVAYPIIYPQQAVLFQTDDEATEEHYTYPGFLNTFFDAIDGSYCPDKQYWLDPHYPDNRYKKGAYKGKLQCGKYKPTNVISISYIGIESGLPVKYQRRQCHEIMKLGMQGITVVSASGDDGVGAAGVCIEAAGNSNAFQPGFPVTCPYVTSVGGTSLQPGSSVTADQEVAADNFPSGGGFSNIYKRPDYQSKQVLKYLKDHNPGYPSYSTTNAKKIGPGKYNREGRGFPDVSAVSTNILIFNKGLPSLAAGTSAATPLFASMLTRINEERLRAGKKTVGFVNPVLYKHPEAFNDIHSGQNVGCSTKGFLAQPGWDPVTGLGTPNYPKLLKIFMDLP